MFGALAFGQGAINFEGYFECSHLSVVLHAEPSFNLLRLAVG